MKNSRAKKRAEIEIKAESPSKSPSSSPSAKRSRSATAALTKKKENADADAVAVEVKRQQSDEGKAAANDDEHDGGPFPNWCRPSEAECFAARDALALLHGEPTNVTMTTATTAAAAPTTTTSSSPSPSSPSRAAFSDPDGCHNDCLSVLDSLVRTILSQNTTDATSARAFRSLKRALPTWEAARTAPRGVMEEAIRVGGLAEIKAARIRKILETIRAEAIGKKKKETMVMVKTATAKKEKEEDKTSPAAAAADAESLLSLEYLRGWRDRDAVVRELVRFDGVGPKTAACVVLFALGRADFPVDTHVNRIASAHLGWVPKNSSREQSYEHLRRRVPDSVAHDLHVLLVAHGKVCPSCKSVGRGGSGGGGGGKGGKCELRAAVAAVVERERKKIKAAE